MAANYADATRELDTALSVARTHNLPQKIASVNLSRARLFLEMADYSTAGDLLSQILREPSGSGALDARLTLARSYTRLGDFRAATTVLAAAAADLDAHERLNASFLALVEGEAAYQSNRLEDARRHFAHAASFWQDSYTYGPAVEGLAQLGFVDALLGRQAQGRAAIEKSLTRATAMQRTALAAEIRVLLARVHLLDGRSADALRVLDEIPVSVRDGLGKELRAHLHYCRSKGLGAGPESSAELTMARTLLRELRMGLPEPAAAAFANRMDVRMMTE